MNQILQENKLHENRMKRGAFDGIGWLANKLFGVMDADHANILQTDIAECKTNLNHATDLLKRQTNTVELTANIMKSLQTESASNLKRVVDAVETAINTTELNKTHNQVLGWIMYI